MPSFSSAEIGFRTRIFFPFLNSKFVKFLYVPKKKQCPHLMHEETLYMEECADDHTTPDCTCLPTPNGKKQAQ